MKVTKYTRDALAVRRQRRDLTAKGFERIEGPWQLKRGGRYHERIVEAVVSADGLDVFVRTEEAQR